MKLKDLCSYLDSAVPLSFQESYDNSGIQVGIMTKKISSALVTLDVTEEVLEEAIAGSHDLIISHHPLIFSPLKKITGSSVSERILMRSVEKSIAIYSSHTNLDVFNNGVSWKMAQRLNLQNIKVLSPLRNKLLKLVTYIPETHFTTVSEALFSVGAGVIGNYDKCGFSSTGTGSFRGNESSNPFAGKKGTAHFEKEIRFETILFSHLKDRIISVLLESHPYEEVAYDLYQLDNENVNIGLGSTGELESTVSDSEFVKLISTLLEIKCLRHSKLTDKRIRKVAVCGGSGAQLLGDALLSGADAFISSEFKYHSFHEAANEILIIDAGHYETEKYATEILYDLIIKKFPKFAVRFSKINTNPINYLYDGKSKRT
jgi:dinuclear metal center YbgI/SA1388 family protein